MARKSQNSDFYLLLFLFFGVLRSGTRGDDEAATNTSCPAIPQITGVKPVCTRDDYNGTCLEPQKVGTTATFNCAPCFRSEGAIRSITCQPNGTWSNEPRSIDDGCRWNCGPFQLPVIPPHILGGTVVSNEDRTKWPWHAALYYVSGNQTPFVFCGGTLVAPNAILTAAHCVVEVRTTTLLNVDKIQVFLGKREGSYEKVDNNTQTIPIKLFVIYDTYVPENHLSDIAVVILERPVEITNFVRPARIPTDHDLTEKILEQAKPGGPVFGTTVGFGLDETRNPSKYLRRLDAPVISPKECKHYMDRELGNIFKYQPSTICSGRPHDRAAVCMGDSGGGLVIPQNTSSMDNVTQYFVHGVMSHGLTKKSANASDFCQVWSYKIYTKVQPFSYWIRKILEENPVISLEDEVTTVSAVAPTPVESADTTTAAMGSAKLANTFLRSIQRPPSYEGLFECPPADLIAPCLCHEDNGGYLKCNGKGVTSKMVETTLLKFLEVNKNFVKEESLLSLQLVQISDTDLTTLNLSGLLPLTDQKLEIKIHNLTVTFNGKLERLWTINRDDKVKLKVTHLNLEGNPRMTKDQGSLSNGLSSLLDLQSLRSLNLANSGLKTLSAPAFAPLLFHQVKDDLDLVPVTLNLTGNLLVCDENLTWLARNYSSINVSTAAAKFFEGQVPKCAGHPSRTIISFNFPYTVRGYPCMSACSQQGQNYYWCYTNETNKAWDYCSLPGKDRYGVKCEEPCEFHEPRICRPYYFCSRESSWDKCSPPTLLAAPIKIYIKCTEEIVVVCISNG